MARPRIRAPTRHGARTAWLQAGSTDRPHPSLAGAPDPEVRPEPSPQRMAEPAARARRPPPLRRHPNPKLRPTPPPREMVSRRPVLVGPRQVLSRCFHPSGKMFGQSNVTPLITTAIRGQAEEVNLLLERVSGLAELSKGNGKNALHFAARLGHVEIVKALLDADTQLGRRTDKKGQSALHMAVKGTSPGVVQALVNADPPLVMLTDRNGNLPLHVATRKKRSEIVNMLLLLPDVNVNALTWDRKTAFDIAEGLPLSEESQEIKECLSRAGAVRANDLNQPRDELRKIVTEIKKDVHTQLEQARKTNKNVLRGHQCNIN